MGLKTLLRKLKKAVSHLETTQSERATVILESSCSREEALRVAFKGNLDEALRYRIVILKSLGGIVASNPLSPRQVRQAIHNYYSHNSSLYNYGRDWILIEEERFSDIIHLVDSVTAGYG